ncbi:MAG: cellulase family glycosylhydrolase [Lentisphaeria bacterium]|nr:cellulase family glycosylhydrolase [Lentisphaeria bacterium]
MLKKFFLFLFTAAAVAAGELPVHDFATIAAGKSAVRAVSSGKGLKAALKRGTLLDKECAVFTVSPGNPAAKDKWAALGFQFEQPASSRCLGVRWQLAIPEEITLTAEFKHLPNVSKGFWNGWRLGGVRNVTLKPGIQTLDVYWNECGVKGSAIAKVNGAVLSRMTPGTFGVLSFSLITAENAKGSSNAVRFFAPEIIKINPVARPMDAILMALNGVVAGKGMHSAAKAVEKDGVTGIRWYADAKPGTKSWAVLGVGLFDMPDPGLAGMSFDIDVPKTTVITVETCYNFNRLKGFYGTKRATAPVKMTLKPGRQKLVLDWGMLRVPAKLRHKVNAVRFAMHNAGDTIDFYGADMLYPSTEAADARRAEESGMLAAKQNTMMKALAARKIKWQDALQKLSPAEREPLIWDGIMLSAQREQLAYFGKMTSPNSALEKENAALVDAGAKGNFKDMRSKTEALQTKIDRWIDGILKTAADKDRRFVYDRKEKIFRYPDGRMYRPFAPHFFRALYAPDGLLAWRKWDIRYLAGLGFNGIRLHVVWKKLEPQRGKFDPQWLAMYREICAEAERYGFGVSFDLHWPYPDWFVAGNPALKPPKKAHHHNSYHWQEPLVDAWERIGREFADIPNIAAFEIPTNETPIAGTPDGLTRYPELMAKWNAFLKNKYKTREALEKAWAGKESLLPEEDWDKNSIKPLGFRNPGVAAEKIYAESPRFYDHLLFCADLQKDHSGRILRALRKNIPGAQGMFQRTIGDIWDNSPVRVDYHSIMTSVGKDVLPGTHYNIGGLQARKTLTLTQASYDSEQQMENNSHAVRNHTLLGGGVCPFSFHFLGGGGMLLSDHEWHLKPSVGYLSEMADWVRTYRPAKKKGISVAVITNARLEASTGHQLGDLAAELEKRNCNVAVFESIRIMDEPALLNGYKAVITNSGFMDIRLLDILRKSYKGKVLLCGRLDKDAYARTGKDGLPGYLANGFLLKTPEIRQAAELSGIIDLTGEWDFAITGKNTRPLTAPPAKFGKTEKITVPRLWGEVGLTGSLQYRLGDGWYIRDITIPADWKGRPLSLKIGAIDDLDWVFFNGKLIGHTGEKVPNYWVRAREYKIPAELIRWGKPNQLRIAVRNLRDDGGIHKGPVVISGNAPGTLTLGGKPYQVGCGEDTPLLKQDALTSGTKVLAELTLPGKNEKYAAFLKRGNIYWYFDSNAASAQGKVLDKFLADAK